MAKIDECYVERLCNAVAKTLIEAFENLTIEDVNMYQLGYRKAIDDFAEIMINAMPGYKYFISSIAQHLIGEKE